MVQGVLDLWIDVTKRRILEGWLAHVLHGGPVDAANGCFVPRVQISSLSKEVGKVRVHACDTGVGDRDGYYSITPDNVELT